MRIWNPILKDWKGYYPGPSPSEWAGYWKQVQDAKNTQATPAGKGKGKTGKGKGKGTAWTSKGSGKQGIPKAKGKGKST